MKKYLYLFIIGGMLLSTSCEEYLEETPPGEFAPGNVLTNEDGLRALLYSAYQNYNLMQRYKDVINISEVTTDVAFNTGGGENRTLRLFIDFTWDPSVGWLQVDMWNQQYFAIRDANLLLANVNEANIPDDKKALFTAEAKYIRGTMYADLYNWYGPVPLVTNPEDGSLPRASEEEMLTFIENDLTQAIPNLPDPGQAEQYGRATKGHALGILTKFYLNTKQWQKVLDATEQLMDFNYYELFPNFQELFRVENEGNKEMVVALPMIVQVPFGNNFPNGALPPGFVTSPQVPEFTWTTDMANWATQYRLRDEFINTFDPEDERFGLIITEYINRNGNTVNLLNNPDNARSLKYFDNTALGNFHGNDYPIVRYADILLARAEALNELNGPTQEALDLINLVRNRAGLDDLSMAEATSKDVFRDLILQERGWEFVSEGKRREDLIRHGKFIEYAKARGIENAKPYHVKFPIPEGEMNANEFIEQNNEGY